MKGLLKIGILEFDIQWLDAEANIELIRKRIEESAGSIDLLILPEMCLSGFCMKPELAAISEDAMEIKNLLEITTQYNVDLIGSFSIVENGKYFNRVLLMTDGKITGRYDKLRLFSPSGENEVFSSKYPVSLIDYKGWKILPQVCYDLRFPENVRPLEAPDLLIYMANWPKPRIHHWDALLKARAIENLCFTIGCNRIGKDENDWEYPGHSAVLAMDGAVIIPENEVYSLDYEVMTNYRSKYQFLGDK